MDREVDAVKEHVHCLQVNTNTVREYEDKIEPEIRIIKERTRCTSGEFPFQIIPTMVLIYIYTLYTLWHYVSMYLFPIRSSITRRFLSRELVTGLIVNCLRHCQF